MICNLGHDILRMKNSPLPIQFYDKCLNIKKIIYILEYTTYVAWKMNICVAEWVEKNKNRVSVLKFVLIPKLFKRT